MKHYTKQQASFQIRTSVQLVVKQSCKYTPGIEKGSFHSFNLLAIGTFIVCFSFLQVESPSAKIKSFTACGE